MPYAEHHRREKEKIREERRRLSGEFKNRHKKNYKYIKRDKSLWNKGKNNPNYRGTDVTYNCMECGKITTVCLSRYNKSKHHTCSKKCDNIWRTTLRGNKATNWKGGKRTEHAKIRASLEYKKWRMDVLIRDNFTCQLCKKVGESIEVHHIKSFSNFPELRFEINNGISLCFECHVEVDKYRKRFRR